MILDAQQSIHYICADVTSFSSSKEALEQASKFMSNFDCVFLCAGAAKPGLFLEQPVTDFEEGMRLNYFGSLYSAKVI